MISLKSLFNRVAGKRVLNIPYITENELGIETISVTTIENKHVNGNVSNRELNIISKIVAKQKPKTIFEIGTFDGRTTINLARCAPDDAKVFTLDLPQQDIARTKYPLYSRGFSSDLTYINKSRSGARWEGKTGSEKITQLYGDSATFDYSHFLGQVDFVFVDGSHAKDYVRNDTEIAFTLINKKGIILWHDYGVWKDVSDVLDSYYEKDSRFINARHIKGTCFVVLSLE